MSRDEETVEIEGTAMGETEMAVLFDTGDEAVWIPKSQIIERWDDEDNEGLTTLVITEWLAIKKGLV
jgi:hypothetical protein